MTSSLPNSYLQDTLSSTISCDHHYHHIHLNQLITNITSLSYILYLLHYNICIFPVVCFLAQFAVPSIVVAAAYTR